MVTALIADIHGNLPALKAVLADIESRKVQRILGLGDFVGKGPDSAECLRICRENCALLLRGNWDLLVTWHENEQFRFIRDQIGPEACRCIESLPDFLYATISGHTFKFFHGRPILPKPLWVNSSEELNRLAVQAGDQGAAEYIGLADTHHVFERDFEKHVLFNAGSVGNTCDGIPAANYVLLHGRWESKQSAPLSIEHVRVPYDAAESRTRALSCQGLPNLNAYLQEIETGLYGRG